MLVNEMLSVITFKSRLVSLKNYSLAFNNGSKNLRASNFKLLHQCTRKLCIFSEDKQGTFIVECSTIAIALVGIDEAHSDTLGNQFQLAYFIAKEKLLFSKMQSVYELEEKHKVQLGDGYKITMPVLHLLNTLLRTLNIQLLIVLTM